MTNARKLLQLCAACACLLQGAAAQAQQAFGCTDLSGRHGLPSVEGTSGVFYTITPDLQMFHPFAHETIEDMAKLSRALASAGTTLIFAPLPAKGLAMPGNLPDAARDLGFDPTLAATTYDETVRQLAQAGVSAVNLRRALVAQDAAQPSVLATDDRLTGHGARRVARAIGDVIATQPAYAEMPKGRFETRSSGTVTLDSDMRTMLQRHCLQPLPAAQMEGFATTRVSASLGASATTAFATSGTAPRVAIMGTDKTADPAANLAGFLSEFSGLDVVEYTVPGGDAFAAISTFVTSRSFQEARPAFLVWMNPVEQSLARTGDQPMAELTAAAAGLCQIPLPVLPGRDATMLIADLGGLDPAQSYTLFLDAEGAPATQARFDFVSGVTGMVRSRTIVRHPKQMPTGRFFMPMTGLPPDGARTLEVVMDVPFGPTARLTACTQPASMGADQ